MKQNLVHLRRPKHSRLNLLLAFCANIEGDITIDEVKQLLDSYYESKNARGEVEERTEEADKVSARITEILTEKTFEEKALLEFVKTNPKVTQEQIAEHIGKSTRTVKRFLEK